VIVKEKTIVMPTPIERTPNIGETLAQDLRHVGIDSLEALVRVGFWDAWQQLRRAKPERDCLPSALALAGAVAGVRWNHLPPRVRADIRQRVKAARV
jgi:DNA transformation protein